MNETLRTVDGRSVLRTERRLAHRPEKVWRAFTEPAHLTQWFPADMEMELRVGATVSFVFRDDEGPAMDGVVVELDPPRVFAYTWDDELLHWELRPDGEGCLLILTHTFDDRPGAASLATGWRVCLDALDMVLDGRPVQEPGNVVELHEAYVEAFGLNEGSSEVTPDGWRARFERQLMHPIEAVWATLSAASVPVVGGPAPQAFTTGSVPAGAVTAVEVPTLLEYDWLFEGRPGGRVRWELSDGFGGARLVLSQTGLSEQADERSTALAAWQTHIALLAKRLQFASR
ncbi:MAG: SRPBCC family protein [Egibacteraceae bacterium]